MASTDWDVLRAYGELWAQGYLESRPGSYTTIRRRAPTKVSVEADGRTRIDWRSIASPAAESVLAYARRFEIERHHSPELIDLARLSADPRLTPLSDIRRAFRDVLARDGRELLDYGDPAGYRPLRDAIARHMRVHGVAIDEDEIVVTAGAQTALDLLHRALERRGDAVAVESPTDSAALSFRLSIARASEPEIAEAARRLGRALASAARGRRTRRSGRGRDRDRS